MLGPYQVVTSTFLPHTHKLLFFCIVSVCRHNVRLKININTHQNVISKLLCYDSLGGSLNFYR